MKRKSQRWLWFVGLLTFTLIAVLWWANYQAKQSVNTKSTQVAAVLPLTGSAAQIGSWQQHGIDLAIEKINQQGGYQGKPITVTYEDSQSDPKTGVAALQKILATSEPPVVFSSLSSVSSAVLPILNQNQTTSMLLAVSLPGITERSSWTFRCNLGSEEEAEAMAAYLGTTPIRRVAVAYINDEFGVGAVSIFRKAAQQHQFEVTMAEAYTQDSSDFRTLITKLRSTNPEAVYVIGYVKASVLLIKQLRELGINTPILGNMALSVPSFLQLGGQSLDGAIFTVTQFNPKGERPELKAFVKAYQARYQEEPTFFSAFAYDGMMLIEQAAKKQGFSSAKIREGLLEVRDYPGVLGSLTVQPNRTIKFPIQIVQNKKGVLVPVEKPKGAS
jgi:branched-chain amino acid transport system substrate-binding protein